MWGIETYISNGSGGHIKAVLEKAEMAWMMKNQAINITTGVNHFVVNTSIAAASRSKSQQSKLTRIMSLLPWLKKLDNPPPSVEDASIDREEPEAAVQDIQATEASTSSLVEDTTSLIPELSFPQRIFGTQKRSFCSSWYGKYKWLHYQEVPIVCFAIIV